MFDRVPSAYRPIIEAARAQLPRRVTDLVQPRFLCGVDPRFVGLHPFTRADLGPEYDGHNEGLDYGDFPHVVYARWSPIQHQVIVLPTLAFPKIVGAVVHEYGHCYDEATGHTLEPPITTSYSWVSREERVAEALEELCAPSSGEWELYLSSEAFRPFREAVGIGSAARRVASPR